jgi:hypothetical protein
VWLGNAIVIEAALSFLGLGTPPPTPTWGGTLSGEGRRNLETAPYLAIFSRRGNQRRPVIVGEAIPPRRLTARFQHPIDDPDQLGPREEPRQSRMSVHVSVLDIAALRARRAVSGPVPHQLDVADERQRLS